MPERLVPTMVAAKSASTLRSSFNSNGEPQKRWIRPATMTASPAFATAEDTEFQMLRSPSKLAAIVAATTPTTTVHPAAEPRAIKIPEATPAAPRPLVVGVVAATIATHLPGPPHIS